MLSLTCKDEKSLHVKHSEALLEPELLKWNKTESKEKQVASLDQSDTKKLNLRCYSVTGNAVNVRKQPNTNSESMATYNKGEKICGKEWHGVWLKVEQGWVSSVYLARIQNYASRQ